VLTVQHGFNRGNPSIGSNAQSSTIWTGLISNLRVSKGTALYTSNFTPSITALTTTSQGATAGNISLLTLQNDTLVVMFLTLQLLDMSTPCSSLSIRCCSSIFYIIRCIILCSSTKWIAIPVWYW
jgi:hypothetical protein